MRLAIALVALGALAACGPKQGGADAQAGPGGPGGPPSVTVAPPLVKPIVDWDDYIGRFVAIDQVEVRPRVSGYIEKVAFRDGDAVRAGQLLFVIDPRPFAAALAQAKGEEARARAAAEVARTNYARSQKLLELKAISQEEYDTTRATLGQSEAGLQAARATVEARALDVGFTRVTAPISGQVSDARLRVGNYVASGDTILTTIVSLDPIYFEFTGSEGVYLKYQRANAAGTRTSSRVAPNPVDIRLSDETDYRWRGRMVFVDNALDTGSGTIRGRAVVRNPDRFLTPGMFGHMRLIGSGAYNGMLIPESSVVTDQTQKVVLVVGPDNIVSNRVVTLGPLIEGLRVVRGGLKPSDRIIIDGVQRARPGLKVAPKPGKIVPPAPGTGPTLPPVSEPPASTATLAGTR